MIVAIADSEKTPYPPAYTEIYPAVPPAEMSPQNNMGWSGPATEVVVAQPPPVYVIQPVGNEISLNFSAIISKTLQF